MVLEFKERWAYSGLITDVLQEEEQFGWKLYQVSLDSRGNRLILLCRPKI